MSDGALTRRCLISDLGGVLTTPLIEAFAAYQKHSGIGFELLGQALVRSAERLGEHPLFELEKGCITEAEFIRRLEAELPAGTRLDGFRDVYWDALQPNRRMLEYVRELHRRGVRLALLTNNVREWDPIWREKIPEIDELFEVVVDSAFVGMRKPDPDIYRVTLERLGDLRPGECVFLDDIDLNVQTARELGLHGVLFGETEQAIADVEAALGGAA